MLWKIFSDSGFYNPFLNELSLCLVLNLKYKFKHPYWLIPTVYLSMYNIYIAVYIAVHNDTMLKFHT